MKGNTGTYAIRVENVAGLVSCGHRGTRAARRPRAGHARRAENPLPNGGRPGMKTAPHPMASPKTRMPGGLRKAAITQVALGLFAQKGFYGVTTSELAKTCGVSEALLFQYFPSKAAIFNDMLLKQTDYIEPVYNRFNELSPCAGTLVELVYNFLYRVVKKQSLQGSMAMLLFYRSFVDDGVFASRFLHGKRLRLIKRKFEASLSMARKSGDALPLSASPHDLFWFVQHVASMACLIRLSRKRAVHYSTNIDAAIGEMALFALRGIGVTDATIRRFATPENFAAWRAFYT
jgi:AcrR family transcriptional regulator